MNANSRIHLVYHFPRNDLNKFFLNAAETAKKYGKTLLIVPTQRHLSYLQDGITSYPIVTFDQWANPNTDAIADPIARAFFNHALMCLRADYPDIPKPFINTFERHQAYFAEDWARLLAEYPGPVCPYPIFDHFFPQNGKHNPELFTHLAQYLISIVDRHAHQQAPHVTQAALRMQHARNIAYADSKTLQKDFAKTIIIIPFAHDLSPIAVSTLCNIAQRVPTLSLYFFADPIEALNRLPLHAWLAAFPYKSAGVFLLRRETIAPNSIEHTLSAWITPYIRFTDRFFFGHDPEPTWHRVAYFDHHDAPLSKLYDVGCSADQTCLFVAPSEIDAEWFAWQLILAGIPVAFDPDVVITPAAVVSMLRIADDRATSQDYQFLLPFFVSNPSVPASEFPPESPQKLPEWIRKLKKEFPALRDLRPPAQRLSALIAFIEQYAAHSLIRTIASKLAHAYDPLSVHDLWERMLFWSTQPAVIKAIEVTHINAYPLKHYNHVLFFNFDEAHLAPLYPPVEPNTPFIMHPRFLQFYRFAMRAPAVFMFQNMRYKFPLPEQPLSQLINELCEGDLQAMRARHKPSELYRIVLQN